MCLLPAVDGGNCFEENLSVTQLRKTLSVVFVKNWLAEEGVDAPSKVALRLPIAKTFSHKANGTRGATFAAPNRWFL